MLVVFVVKIICDNTIAIFRRAARGVQGCGPM